MAAIDSLMGWHKIMEDAVRDDGPDLSMRQWAIMLSVYLKSGPHTVRKLSQTLNVPKPAISRALDTLSILGFVRRVRDPEDKRIVIVHKTSGGAIFLDEFARLVDSHTGRPSFGALYGS